MRQVALLTVVLLAAPARGEESTGSRVASALLVGLGGVAVAGAYTAGAFLTADQPSGRALAISGGVVSLGLTGLSLGLAVNANRKDPGSMARFILLPLLSGLAGAALGGLAAGFGAWEPGPARTATHVTVVTLFVGVTILTEFIR